MPPALPPASRTAGSCRGSRTRSCANVNFKPVHWWRSCKEQDLREEKRSEATTLRISLQQLNRPLTAVSTCKAEKVTGLASGQGMSRTYQGPRPGMLSVWYEDQGVAIP